MTHLQSFIIVKRAKAVGLSSEGLRVLDLLQAVEHWRTTGTREADFALMAAINRFEVAQAQGRAS